MSFDKDKRVKFRRSPLDEVICQLRFPTILKIDQNLPVDFQSLIEERFPYVNDGIDMSEPIETRFSGGQELSFNVAINSLQQQRKFYSFSNEDNDTSVMLTRNSLSLSTQKYDCWENFRLLINFVLKAFVQCYGKKELTRVGIRYINAVSRKFADTPWSDLIDKRLLGMMCDSDIGGYVKGLNSTLFLKYDDSSVNMQVRSGIFLKTNSNPAQEVFLIDCDSFSIVKSDTDNVMALLERLHDKPSIFLRHAITEKLYKIMEPEEIS